VRALLATRSIVGLPGVSLVPYIPNISRGHGNQIGTIDIIILESNRSNNWSRHGVDDECLEGVNQRGKTQPRGVSEIDYLYFTAM